MKRAIELIRVSTEAQSGSDRASIPAQRTANRQTCARYGLEIVRSYEITDVSGASVLLAPETQQWLRLIQDPEIHGVVTREFSRLMRPENFSDYALLQAFIDTKTVLYLPDGPIDFSNKSGRLIGTIRAAIAGMERSEILERIWASKEDKRKRGEHPGSEVCLPYGVSYDRKAARWHYTNEASNVREMFRRFLSGETNYRSLCHLAGVTPAGARIILSNPIYTGWRVYAKQRDMSSAGKYVRADGRQADRRKVQRQEIIRVRVIESPLISEADFAQAQKIVSAKRAGHWRVTSPERTLFTYNGFLLCSLCGRPIYTRLAKRYYYVCSGRIPGKLCQAPYMDRDRLEAQLDSLLADKLTDLDFLNSLVERWTQREESNDVTGKTAIANLRKLSDKRERILEAYFEGTILKADRDGRIAKIAPEIAAAQETILRMANTSAIDANAIARAMQAFVSFGKLERAEKRMLLADAVGHIRVADYQVAGLELNQSLFVLTSKSRRGMGLVEADTVSYWIPVT